MRTTRVCSILTALLLAACGGPNADGGSGGNTGGERSHLDVAQHPMVECNGDAVCTIREGTVEKDLTLSNDGDVQYVLGGEVFVGDGDSETVLTVEPGVTVFGESGTSSEISFLTIRQNSKIVASGTKEKPIVFTSSAKEGDRGRGQWGGLIINGRAPINAGSTAEGEGGTGTYGGDKPNDDSGTLEYVRVEYAGALITSENELNGIAFQGVGSGTTVDNVQVHMNADDGVEFFGGTVSAKHLLLTGIGDDSVDWTSGWRGKLQHVVIHQYEDRADRGIEADNFEASHDKTPRSQPTISNITVYGSENSSAGMLFRRGTGANVYNAVITGSGGPCLDLDSLATFENAWNGGGLSGALSIHNSIVAGCSKNFASDEEESTPMSVEEWYRAGENNRTTDPGFDNPGAKADPDYTIPGDSPATSGAMQPEGDSWFDSTGYAGGCGPETDWTDGWTQQARE